VAQRLLLYGVTGSGKTTLAEQIAARTGIPFHSVDDLTWQPGWVPVPIDEQRRRIEAICAGDAWILDTAYYAWLDVPLARSDLIVALDYPRWFSLARLLRRTVTRMLDGRPVCNGNRESLRHVFSYDSIVLWHFRSFDRKRARIRSWAADPAMPAVLRLVSPQAAERWLATLAPQTAAVSNGTTSASSPSS
jgi:adenylate kinase family enzyme